MLGLRLLQISRAIDRRSAVVADVVDVAADETLYLFIFIYFFVVARALQATPKQNIAHGAHDFAPDTDAPAVFEESILLERQHCRRCNALRPQARILAEHQFHGCDAFAFFISHASF